MQCKQLGITLPIKRLKVSPASKLRSGTSAPDPTGVGGGADAQPTSRVYDKFVQRKILQENPRSGMFKSRGEFLQKIEIIFSETEGNGLHQALNEFWNSWSQLSNQPESESARMQVKVHSDVNWYAAFVTCTLNLTGCVKKLTAVLMQI